MLIRVLSAFGAGVFLAAGASAVQPGPSQAPALLPDLVQDPPSHLIATQTQGEYRLNSRSAVRNVGSGQLLISGHRPDRTNDAMRADQIMSHGAARRALRRGRP